MACATHVVCGLCIHDPLINKEPFKQANKSVIILWLIRLKKTRVIHSDQKIVTSKSILLLLWQINLLLNCCSEVNENAKRRWHGKGRGDSFQLFPVDRQIGKLGWIMWFLWNIRFHPGTLCSIISVSGQSFRFSVLVAPWFLSPLGWEPVVCQCEHENKWDN